MPSAIYTTLLSEIDAILEAVKTDGKLGVVYNHPVTKPTAYPAAIFYPDTMENSFETVSQNFKVYRFKLFVVLPTDGTSKAVSEVWGTLMPNAVDAVMAAFDSGWSLTNIDGNRVWVKIDSGQWGMSDEQVGQEAWAELNIEVKLSTNN